MTQQQTLQLFLPVLILLPVLYFRMRRMTKAQPLKLSQLWIRPALILAITALALFAPPPGQHVVRQLMPLDWAWLALAAGIGGVGGWYWAGPWESRCIPKTAP
jgi:H+/gluconate symporter-like permease